MQIDTTTEFGERTVRRLEKELIGWLTTVDASGGPQPSPIWFVWDGETELEGACDLVECDEQVSVGWRYVDGEWAPRHEGRVMTAFERKGLRVGREIRDLTYRRRERT